MVTSVPRLYWSLDHERIWFASALSVMLTPADKIRFITRYLLALKKRAISFDGETDMESDERREMETFGLKQLYTLQDALHE